ncbi:DUF1302 domain-containing protein [Acidocella sp.]|uniref:DUF1302 domain-containing protein n=1 Tax=Acidocella sp. TaxID=50710 RepID=UPI002603B000|nr:DUF1302 family protein [Acidocella sp.]
MKTNAKKRAASLPPFPIKAGLCIALGLLLGQTASAYQLDAGPDWNISLDSTIQYTLGARAQSIDPGIGNNPAFAEGDYKFPNSGDVNTNRLDGIFSLTGTYRSRMGFRFSGEIWKDFAYDANVNTAPAFAGNPAFSTYVNNTYSAYTKRYYIQGVQGLDAFVFDNTSINNIPVYLKVGRFATDWGTAMLFGFSNIAYSQSGIDYGKAFAQPGTQLDALYLPRAQLLGTVAVSPDLSLTGQYFLEHVANRYPEGGTYLSVGDFAYNGPQLTGLGLGGTAGTQVLPKNNNGNFGVKAKWSPDWAEGDIGFYYRVLDEAHPWLLLDPAAMAAGKVQVDQQYAQKVKLYGMSYEHTIGNLSTGYELSYRQGTALNSTALAVSEQGAKGDIVNVIANVFDQLGPSRFWDTGMLIAEASYTHLVRVTDNANLYQGLGQNGCTNKWAGCATNNSLALGVVFEPQWLQIRPGWDLGLPISYTYGVYGNPAYAASAFYAQGTSIYSVGVSGTYEGRTSVTLQYNGYHWHTLAAATGGGVYPGGNGPYNLNDKGWVELTVKTSF